MWFPRMCRPDLDEIPVPGLRFAIGFQYLSDLLQELPGCRIRLRIDLGYADLRDLFPDGNGPIRVLALGSFSSSNAALPQAPKAIARVSTLRWTFVWFLCHTFDV